MIENPSDIEIDKYGVGIIEGFLDAFYELHYAGHPGSIDRKRFKRTWLLETARQLDRRAFELEK